MQDNFPIQHYRNIVNAINEAIMVVGPDGVIILVNNALVKLTGFLKEELVGSHCTILNCDACEPDQVDATGHWCKLFDIGLMEDKDCMFIRKDGSHVSVIKSAQILSDEQGKVIGILETFTELSDTLKKDQIKNKLTNLIEGDTGFFGMIGNSAVMQDIYHVIIKAAQVDSPVIIYGESGTGKELASYAIHKLGPRKDGPFVRCNCGALNESLLESELFGHAKGAFTGAYQNHEGRFQAAHGGDIFLDEIGEIPMSAQKTLLHVLENKQFEPVGDNRSIDVDVRIICATNRNLQQRIKIGEFRDDLFFRINVVPIHLPPLRDRKEDIPLLVHGLTHKLRAKTQREIEGVSDDVLDLFYHYDWPGNVRELRSTLEYAFVLADTEIIEPLHLPPTLKPADSGSMPGPKQPPQLEPNNAHQLPPPHTPAPAGNQTWREKLNAVIQEEDNQERAALVEALRISRGNKTAAAKLLGVHRMTVWNRMRKYGISLKNDVHHT
jgi:two-component system, NtrC family, response regulator HydG